MDWLNLADLIRMVRAIATDQIAWLAPALYVRLTRQTGRGKEEGTGLTADYFRTCFEDYFRMLKVLPQAITGYLHGKHVLEYGPGDVPGVALLMVAHGAETVLCVDRFPLFWLSDNNVHVLQNLLDGLAAAPRRRAEQCFMTPGDPASGFNPARIRYLVKPNGVSGLINWADLIVSRAVLEHVNDLGATFADMRDALCPDAVAIHLVDLASHGLHRRNPLDFLNWPPRLWALMYGHKGVPNRWRVNRYREVVSASGLQILTITPVTLLEQAVIDEVRPYLAPVFRQLSDADLAWLSFWLVCRKQILNS